MEKIKSLRYEQTNKILKICEKPKTVEELIRAGIPRSTVYYVIKDLKNKKLEEINDFDKNGHPVKKYQNVIYKNVINPQYLTQIIENYKSNNKERVKSACNEMITIGFSDKKVLDKEYIEFLIDEDKKNFLNRKRGVTYVPLLCVIAKLKIDIKKHPFESDKLRELMKFITKRGGHFYQKIALDSSINVMKRYNAYHILNELNHPEIFDITVNILKNIQYQKNQLSDVEKLFQVMSKRVNVYFESNSLDCKKKLWEAYESNKDERIKKKIYDLIQRTSIGYEKAKEIAQYILEHGLNE